MALIKMIYLWEKKTVFNPKRVLVKLNFLEVHKATSCCRQLTKTRNKMNESIITEVPYKEISLLILGTLSTFLIWRIQHQKDKIKDIENLVSEKKYKLYSELIYIFFDIANGEKIGKKMTDRELLKRILDIKKDMFLYAPDSIFKMFTKWTLELNKENGTINQFKTYFQLIKLVRQDMGNSKTKIELDDFMLFYMQNEEEYTKFKMIHGW
jgi:hypothetical protein